MHEMSLAENVRSIIEQASREQGFSRVRCVALEIGKLAAVEPEAMRFCFDAAMQGSVAEGATLEIIETPGTGQCQQCGASMPISTLYEACASCGSYAVQVIGGDAMRVKELEVE